MIEQKPPRHKDCINFVNGVCTRFGIPVDPEGPACPNFTPKSQERYMAPTTPTSATRYPPTIPIPNIRYPTYSMFPYRGFIGGRRNRRRRRGLW